MGTLLTGEADILRFLSDDDKCDLFQDTYSRTIMRQQPRRRKMSLLVRASFTFLEKSACLQFVSILVMMLEGDHVKHFEVQHFLKIHLNSAFVLLEGELKKKKKFLLQKYIKPHRNRSENISVAASRGG